jgi:hypothetical protein
MCFPKKSMISKRKNFWEKFELNVNKIILGAIIAIISFSIIVYVIESDKSVLELSVGFFIFIVPITFLSSFQSTATVFILVMLLSFFGYGMYVYEYYDTLFGLLLAIINGGAIAYYRINKYKIFSPSDYKNSIDLREKKDA